ncbi:unnamed protein product [Nesidiocoris tenuis]|uniref:Uncharacterized protein n=1 Tax=Nesidiocoris tenuis TaxID=355587 RepID=A0A6H5HBJ3_9HEMI|nr:unnamed protein product [Nesidiocoris tenuis]
MKQVYCHRKVYRIVKEKRSFTNPRHHRGGYSTLRSRDEFIIDASLIRPCYGANVLGFHQAIMIRYPNVNAAAIVGSHRMQFLDKL